jgi:lipoteichoic acid synthase
MEELQPRQAAIAQARPTLSWWASPLAWGLMTLLSVWTMRDGLRLMGLPPGPMLIWMAMATSLVITPWFMLARPRRQIWLHLGFQLFVSLLMYANLIYYRQFGDLVSIASARFALQLGDVGTAVTDLMRPADLRLFIGPLVALALLFLPTSWQASLFPTRSLRWRAIPSALALALVLTVIIVDTGLAATYFGHAFILQRVGPLGYHAIDIVSYTERMTARLKPDGPQVQKVRDWFAQRPQPKTTPPLQGAYAGKNVIVMQIESLQNFPIGMKYLGQEITPNLNRIIHESMYFPNFWSQVGQGVTSDADLMTNCSLYPMRTGAVYYDFAHNDYYCMPQILKEHGYYPAAFQGIKPDFWNLATVYPQIGFSRYYSIRDYSMTKPEDQIGIVLSDEAFYRQTAEKLLTLPQPFYAFTVSLTSHTPFTFERLPQELKLGALAGTKAGHYIQAIHYTDKAIGLFFDLLKQNGLLDKSIVVIYGDHQGVYQHDPGMPELLGLDPEAPPPQWLPVERKVPLIIHFPGGAHASVQPQLASEVDTGPTLLWLLGIQPKDAFQMGQNMLATDVPKVVSLATGTAIARDYMYVVDAPVEKSCYRLPSGQVAPPAECQAIKAISDRQLDVSRTIIEYDLMKKLRNQESK